MILSLLIIYHSTNLGLFYFSVTFYRITSTEITCVVKFIPKYFMIFDILVHDIDFYFTVKLSIPSTYK